jgi:hypothetical protein
MIQNLHLGAGAMKAGTTWLYSQLIDHPDLYFTPEKEIHFIDAYFNKTNVLSLKNRLDRAKAAMERGTTREYPGYFHNLKWYSIYLQNNIDFSWYSDLFSLNKTQKLNCDYSNLTCQIDEKSWTVIQNLVKELKVTYVLRDPLKRLWSHLKFHHQYAGLKIDFESWTELEFKEYLEKPFIKMNSQYDKWNNIMSKSLDKEQYKVFYFEDFIHDSIRSLRSLEHFLNISEHKYNLEKIRNKVNPSVSKPMPKNFIEASKIVLHHEYSSLAKSGVTMHDKWEKIY